jgi:leucine dehydrogenase
VSLSVTPTPVPDFLEVLHIQHTDSGLDAWLAMHRRPQGRSFGGVRIQPYASDDAACREALGLASAMTDKLAFAGLDEGGAKTVVRLHPHTDRPAAIAMLARVVQDLGGAYACGPDLGFTDADDAVVRAHTEYVACPGLGEAAGHSVALCVLGALDGLGTPASTKVAIQGGGAVGSSAASHLRAAGHEVYVADVVASRADVSADDFWQLGAQVLSPCAIGGVIDAQRAETCTARLIVPGANRVLTRDEVALRLDARGITYVPDFVSNAGAAVVGVMRTLGASPDEAQVRLERMRDDARQLVADARARSLSPLTVARQRVSERVARWG